MNKLKMVMHGAGFALINTACVAAVLGYELPGDTLYLCGGVTLWIWSDSIKVTNEAN